MNATESNCLSALMKDHELVYSAVAQGLSEAHFTEATTRLVFIAILKAATDAKSTQAHAVWQQLATLGGDAPVPISLLLEIDNLQPTQINAKKLIGQVIDAARRRRLQSALTSAVKAAEEPAATFDETWDAVAPHIEAAQSATESTLTRTLAEICEIAAIQIEQPDTRKTVSTGNPDWDKIATPMREGQMITLAGRPGTGKSALAGQIGLSCAQGGGRVAVFSLEMSGEELVERMALVAGGKDALMDRRVLVREIRELARLRTLHIFDNAQKYTMPTIESRCRLLATQGAGLSLVVIDYIQLITPTDRKMPREQQVAEISRSIKQMAGSLKVPVIVLAQLNRESEKDERRPRLSDLRESGSIEQDSDRVWFLWHDTKNASEPADSPAIDVLLVQAKCRAGPANIARPLRFDRPIYTFRSIANVGHPNA
jgi:replicative DNA helicase